LCTSYSELFFDNICGRRATKRLNFYFYVNSMPHSRTLRMCNHSSSCLVQGRGDCRKSINVLLTSITRVTYYHSAPVSLSRKYLRCMKIKESDPTLLERLWLKPFKTQDFTTHKTKSDKDMGLEGGGVSRQNVSQARRAATLPLDGW